MSSILGKSQSSRDQSNKEIKSTTETIIELNVDELQPEGEGNSLLPESECSATKIEIQFVS